MNHFSASSVEENICSYFKLGDCEGMTESQCEDYYRKNAAMVEVFYEQLNYELLQESEAYGVSSFAVYQLEQCDAEFFLHKHSNFHMMNIEYETGFCTRLRLVLYQIKVVLTKVVEIVFFLKKRFH